MIDIYDIICALGYGVFGSSGLICLIHIAVDIVRRYARCRV